MIYEEAAVQRVMRAARDDLDWRDVARNNDINLRTAYRWVAAARANDAWESSPLKPSGGRRNAKITEEHVDYLLNLLDENCYLTLEEMVDELEARYGLRLSRQCVKKHVDGRMYDEANSSGQQLPQSPGKQEPPTRLHSQSSGLHIGRSLKGKRAVNKNMASKGYNIHVIACISENVLAEEVCFFRLGEVQRVYTTSTDAYKKTTPLGNVVLVADNAPCHSSIEEVFEEDAFADAEFLRLGPYSPMLNPIENCFSTFKSMVKRFLARHRPGILQVPPHRTIKAHREEYLKMAADLLVREAITPYLCYQCTLHTMKFHARAIQNERHAFEKVYNFLRNQSGSGTAAHLILIALAKLRSKACNRLFAAYLSTQPIDPEEAVTMRSKWDQTLRVPRSHYGYNRQWNLENPDEINILIETVHEWCIQEKASQYEVEQRLMAFDLVKITCAPKESQILAAARPKETAYLKAVHRTASTHAKNKPVHRLSSEMEKWYTICTVPARPTTALRDLTSDEARALDLIINGTIEVPTLPPFLPGQTKEQIIDFIAATSKIVYSESQRLLTLVFPSRRLAHDWVGWNMPVGNGEIELHDYITERNSTDDYGLHPHVRLDSHELTVNVLNRELKAEELLRVLHQIMCVPVHNIKRIVDIHGGVDTRMWKVQLTTPTWPTALKQFPHWK
ncbi:LOW QUALITY PROTEIN: hypothetical protein PHMEG_0007703 [Phytophthora megakarya]|uniref:Tc1-like transposase DDE domain-containing protein n=1 Tax=Phytophthora megakarya TaxID=4795 RepID=A0A225WKI8_9STRA|nr:LOW QUALITY PROTEIN: hypothetical protein PHMEG_0007703 [Phytophthora megakarya]